MAQALPTNPPSKLDGEHYWNFVTFSVEGCLFRLPKYRFLEESECFCKEYDLDHGSLTPTKEPEYANIDAHSHSSPSPNSNQRDPAVKLEGVKLVDFRCFLKVLYPRNGEHELATFTPDQWGSVLKLSTKWFFNDIRHRAIKEIDNVNDTMSDVNRIVLAKEYHISEWLLAGYKALIARDEVIDLEEGEKIGLRNTLQLYQLRDKYYRQDWDGETLKTEIMWKFAVEIDEMQSTEREYPTKAEKKAAEEEKARADEELEAVARARQMPLSLSLSEKEGARRKQYERFLELKRQRLAQIEKEKDELLATASSSLEEKEQKGSHKRERAAIERAAATPETSAGEPAVDAKSEESVVGTKEEEPVAVLKVEDPLSAEKQESTEAQIDVPAPEAKVEDAVTEVTLSAEPQLEEVANADQGSKPSATEQAEPNGVEGLTMQTAPALNDAKANDADGTDSPVVGPDSKADDKKARRKAEPRARKKAKKLAEEKAAAAQETTAEGAKPSEEPAAEATPNAPAEKVKLDSLDTQDLSKAEPLIDFSATPPSIILPLLRPQQRLTHPLHQSQ